MENENNVCATIIPKVLRYIEANDELLGVKRWLDVKEHECQEHEISAACKDVSDYREHERITMMNQNINNMKREINEELKKID